jgi:hypothetical protein
MNDQAEQTTTARQLREILFYINDQNMTVGELRKRLFDVQDQDAPITPQFNMWHKLGVEK